MRITILQPNYIPWRGYLSFFKESDVFVFYDDVQYTKNDWRNRNLIKTPQGAQWLTIPIKKKGKFLINEAEVLENGWQKKHLKTIKQNYKDAPYFDDIYNIFEKTLYSTSNLLSNICVNFLKEIINCLDIKCDICFSSEIGYVNLRQTDRLVAICKHFNADEYLTGKTARNYLEVEKFGNIEILWKKYKEKSYPQLWGDFISKVSIIDTIMNCGNKKAYNLL